MWSSTFLPIQPEEWHFNSQPQSCCLRRLPRRYCSFAERRCTSAGKPIEFDVFHPEPGFNGEVHCRGSINIGDADEGTFKVKDGRVVEDGAHDELLARDGRYAELFRLQAARFADEEEDDRG